MATQSPFSMLESILQSFNFPVTPPEWAIVETHRRIVLVLNHVLMQEPQAMERLARQKSRVVLMQWRAFTFKLLISPAGLLDVAPSDARADLVLAITQESPLAIAQELMQGDKPAVRIEGDVQYAALEMHQGALITGQLRPILADEEKPTLKLAANNQ